VVVCACVHLRYRHKLCSVGRQLIFVYPLNMHFIYLEPQCKINVSLSSSVTLTVSFV